MQEIIARKLKQLERIYQSFQWPSFNSFVAPENYPTLLARTQLQKAARLLLDTKTLLLALKTSPVPDSVCMNLLESALEEIQECIQTLQPRIQNINPPPLTRLERQCARESIFSGILALQLFIVP